MAAALTNYIKSDESQMDRKSTTLYHKYQRTLLAYENLVDAFSEQLDPKVHSNLLEQTKAFRNSISEFANVLTKLKTQSGKVQNIENIQIAYRRYA